jgi:hypothetical protein
LFQLLDILLLALLLFPIAVYCTILGMINRRTQPLMVSGAWDFAGVLMATSGFLLFAGPSLLSRTFRQNLRDLPMEYGLDSLGSEVVNCLSAWWIVWLLYYLFVIGGSAFLVWTRRRTSVIYNIDQQTLETVVARTAQRLGLQWRQRGNQFFFTASAVDGEAQTVNADGTVPGSLVSPVIPSGPATVVEVESFPLFSNIALHWNAAIPAARADLERELRKNLAEVFTLENAGGGWLLGIAAFLFLLVMLLTAVFVVIVMRMQRP